MTHIPTDITELQDLVVHLLRDIASLKRDFSVIKSENSELKIEQSRLKSEITAIKSENADLKSAIAALKSENADLKSQLGLNSSNSHKPPTSDGLEKSPKIPTLARGKGGTVGGQKGHKGNNLTMVRDATQIDTVVTHYPQACGRCGQPISPDACQISERRQVLDLPQPKLLVTEHQVFGCGCGNCGHRSFGVFPKGVGAPIQYGSGAKAFAVLLNQQYLLPFAKVSDLFDTLFGQPINVSTLQSSNEAAYRALESTETTIKTGIINSGVAHFDETGLHIKGKLHWLHVAATERYTYFFVHARRGTPALEDTPSVLPHFKGVAVHDCWSSYLKFLNCFHALCNAHLLREFQAALENGYTWAAKLQEQFKELLKLKQTDELTPKIFKKRRKKLKYHLKIIQKALDEATDQTSKIARKTKALVRRLRQHLDKFLAFAEYEQVPFTNNLAERDIRMAKLKSKISGGFRTDKGAYVFARIRGVIATARKQGKDVFQLIKNAIEAQYVPNSPDLLLS